VIIKILKCLSKWQMSVAAVDSLFLCDALFSGVYRVVCSYLVMYYGDKVLGHLSGVWPAHIVAEYAVICSKEPAW
jgi:hypothetical protein